MVEARRGRRRRTVNVNRRIVVLSVGVAALATVLVGRVAWIGSIDAAEFSEMGAQRRSFSKDLVAPRGSIVDRNGEALAMSIPSDLVAVDPTLVKDPETVATTLAAKLDLDRPDVEDKVLTPDTRYVEIARDVTPDLGDEVRALKLDGVVVERRPRRERIGGDVASSIVGRMDAYGDEALSGLEKLFDAELAPTDGEMAGERDAANKLIPGTERIVRSARPGSDLWLTLDRPLQYVAEQVLMDQCNAVGAENATVVVGRTKTSEILAMASVTRNDAGEMVVDTLNQSVREYEPGSVMKMATVSAAYDLGLVQPSTEIVVPDSITLGDYPISDSEPHATYPMTVESIISESSNVGTIKIAQLVGKDSLIDYYKRFGFGRYTTLGIPKEQTGVLNEGRWNASDIGSIPIGQSVTVTPLQMWAAYNVIANGGIYVPPRLVADIVDAEGSHRIPDVGESRRVMSKAAASKVNAALEKVVHDGTGSEWKIDGFRVAAKTGTAWKPLGGGKGYGTAETRKFRSSFVGYFPATDPEISIMVMVDEPKPPFTYGAAAAGPVFDLLAKDAMRRYAIAGDDMADGGAAISAEPAVRIVPAPPTTVVAPVPVDGEGGVDSTSTSVPVGPASTSPPDDEASATTTRRDERGRGNG